jgi:hypothetical protein
MSEDCFRPLFLLRDPNPGDREAGMETPDKDGINSFLFHQLVNTFQNAAWEQLGKRLDPLTNKMEKDFEQASLSIGMLDMLSAKTQGNLSAEEDRFLQQIISDLKLNYVEEMGKSSGEKDGMKDTPPEKEAEAGETKMDKGTETQAGNTESRNEDKS